MMDRASLLDLVEALGREFERRAMHRHLEALRLFDVALRSDGGRVSWSEDLTVEWLARLRLPPYDKHSPVRSCRYRCACGESTEVTEAVFPGGHKLRCTRCGNAWLVIPDTTSR